MPESYGGQLSLNVSQNLDSIRLDCILWQYTKMIDWKQIKGLDRDDRNERKSEEKYAVSRSEAEQMFFNQPFLVLGDKKHSQKEARYHALGRSNDTRLLHVTFTLRSEETLIRIISARDMRRKDRHR